MGVIVLGKTNLNVRKVVSVREWDVWLTYRHLAILQLQVRYNAPAILASLT